MRRALITGATGFVGSHLSRRLAARGDALHLVLRPESDRSLLAGLGDHASFHPHDGTTEHLIRIVEEARPDVVFHLASLFVARHEPRDVEPLFRSNLLFATQLAEALARGGVKRCVNVGTAWEHYENADYDPVCLYAATKRAFETLLRFYVERDGLAVVTLTLFDTYGPNDPRPKLFSLLRRAAESGQRLAMSPGEQLIDLVYVDDVIDAFIIAAERLEAGAVVGMENYPVASGQALPLKTVVETYRRVTGTPLDLEWGARPYREREVMTPWSGGQRLPGWVPKTKLEEGIRRMEEADV